MTPDGVLISVHADRELKAVLDLITRGPLTEDEYRDIAAGLKQVSVRYEHLAEEARIDFDRKLAILDHPSNGVKG